MYTTVIDFGLLVLIWIVQLVVYPSFVYYKEDDLLKWHRDYTFRITLVVLPLMGAQLFLHIRDSYLATNANNIVTLLMVVTCWVLTFFVSVPLHNKVGAGSSVHENAKKLITTNWYRTILWSLISVLSFIQIESI